MEETHQPKMTMAMRGKAMVPILPGLGATVDAFAPSGWSSSSFERRTSWVTPSEGLLPVDRGPPFLIESTEEQDWRRSLLDEAEGTGAVT